MDEKPRLLDCQQTLYESKNPTRRWLHLSRRDWISGRIAKFAGPDKTALEIGIGSGVYLPVLAAGFKSVVAADIEGSYLTNAESLKGLYPNIQTRVDDILDTGLARNSFDLILFSEVLEHIRGTELALKNIAGLLKPGGVLILTTPQRHSLLELTARVALSGPMIALTRLIYQEAVMPLGHINLLSAPSVKKALAEAGLSILEEHKSGLYVPVAAELGGEGARRLFERLQERIRGTPLDFLLWTQFYVARADSPKP